MGLRINTNMMSINAQRNLRGSKMSMESTSEKLSSGYRINKSADDAAGLAISENLAGHIRSFRQSGRKCPRRHFLHSGCRRRHERSLKHDHPPSRAKRASGLGHDWSERAHVPRRECQQLKNEMQRIAKGTEYNGQHLLNGEGEKLDFQIGIKNNDFL